MSGTGEREHVLTGDCWCDPTRERWDEEAQQWVVVTDRRNP